MAIISDQSVPILFISACIPTYSPVATPLDPCCFSCYCYFFGTTICADLLINFLNSRFFPSSTLVLVHCCSSILARPCPSLLVLVHPCSSSFIPARLQSYVEYHQNSEVKIECFFSNLKLILFCIIPSPKIHISYIWHQARKQIHLVMFVPPEPVIIIDNSCI